VEGMLHDGDNIQSWLQNKDYEIKYTFDISALLKANHNKDYSVVKTFKAALKSVAFFLSCQYF